MWEPSNSKKRYKAITRMALVRILIGIVSMTVLYDHLHFNDNFYDFTKERHLSIDHGGGDCEWTPPLYVQVCTEVI